MAILTLWLLLFLILGAIALLGWKEAGSHLPAFDSLMPTGKPQLPLLVSSLNLVFFADACLHLARISRIITQPRGNALLVGVGGSGKQSITRLAAYTAQNDIFSITLTRGYNEQLFREDLKKLYEKAGIEGVDTVFLFNDVVYYAADGDGRERALLRREGCPRERARNVRAGECDPEGVLIRPRSSASSTASSTRGRDPFILAD